MPKLNGEYFLVPVNVFNLGLCSGELAIYAYLRRCIDSSYACWPSYNTIGRAVDLSKNTVK